MFIKSMILAAGFLGQPASPPTCLPADPPLRIVTSLTTYGAIAREIVGDKGTVTSIAQGDEDPHFVQPKPSFVRLLRDGALDGSLRAFDDPEAAATVIYVQVTYAFLHLRQEHRWPAERAAAAVVDLAMGGVRP